MPGHALRDRVAYVTGGASGIGAATVAALTGQGARTIVLDVQSPTEPGTDWIHCDLTDRSAIDRAVRDAERDVGPADILVNNAGVGPYAQIADLDADDWDRALATNLTGAAHLTHLVLPGMTEHGWGRIVSVSSGTAVRVHPGMAAYAASKAGLIAFTKVAALEGAPYGVTANVVAPGLTDTPMVRSTVGDEAALSATASDSPIANPMGAVLAPGDIARTIAFLCAPDSWAISGQVVHVSCGSVMP